MNGMTALYTRTGTIMAALFLAFAWLAALGLPRAEMDPETVLEHDFNTAKAGITAALREHLAAELAEHKAPPLYYSVDIAVTPRADGDYDVEINWHVYDAERSLGAVNQKNVFPGWYVNRGWHSADNGTWSNAAAAAVKGIISLTEPEGGKL